MWTTRMIIEEGMRALAFVVMSLGASAVICWVVLVVICLINWFVTKYKRSRHK